jgi:cytochrome c oxidase cbb3-type subunit 1
VISAQLVWPQLSFDSEHLTFGRLRPLHTSAAVFAFGGTALIGTAFHVVQRTCRARLFGGAPLGWFVLLGYQFFIVMAAAGYLLGITQSKEYAEPEWFVDLWLTIVWVAYLIAYLGTIMKREEPHIYVANWFSAGSSPSCASSTALRCPRCSGPRATPRRRTGRDDAGGTVTTPSASS